MISILPGELHVTDASWVRSGNGSSNAVRTNSFIDIFSCTSCAQQPPSVPYNKFLTFTSVLGLPTPARASVTRRRNHPPPPTLPPHFHYSAVYLRRRPFQCSETRSSLESCPCMKVPVMPNCADATSHLLIHRAEQLRHA